MQNSENISNPHQALYEDLFSKLNPMGKDEIDSTSIAAFLRTAKDVNTTQLSQIWKAACKSSGFVKRGFLNKLGIFMCFKLVAAVQQGFQISPEILCNPSLESPRFEIASFSTTNLLEISNQLIKMSEEQETRLGLALNMFRKKVEDEKLSKRCRALIENWRAIVFEEEGKKKVLHENVLTTRAGRVKNVSQTKNFGFLCMYCKKPFTSKFNLKRHYKNVHKKSEEEILLIFGPQQQSFKKKLQKQQQSTTTSRKNGESQKQQKNIITKTTKTKLQKQQQYAPTAPTPHKEFKQPLLHYKETTSNNNNISSSINLITSTNPSSPSLLPLISSEFSIVQPVNIENNGKEEGGREERDPFINLEEGGSSTVGSIGEDEQQNEENEFLNENEEIVGKKGEGRDKEVEKQLNGCSSELNALTGAPLAGTATGLIGGGCGGTAKCLGNDPAGTMTALVGGGCGGTMTALGDVAGGASLAGTNVGASSTGPQTGGGVEEEEEENEFFQTTLVGYGSRDTSTTLGGMGGTQTALGGFGTQTAPAGTATALVGGGCGGTTKCLGNAPAGTQTALAGAPPAGTATALGGGGGGTMTALGGAKSAAGDASLPGSNVGASSTAPQTSGGDDEDLEENDLSQQSATQTGKIRRRGKASLRLLGLFQGLHGEMEQSERDLIMREFGSDSSCVLITTDLLARGIDVQQDQQMLKELESYSSTQIEEMPAEIGELI
uniref:C2H2-type domain-containing protein n=1 Tax=Meloidogyne javanica TaxID=6303 RepID=A0A915M391_MELJA